MIISCQAVAGEPLCGRRILTHDISGWHGPQKRWWITGDPDKQHPWMLWLSKKKTGLSVNSLVKIQYPWRSHIKITDDEKEVDDLVAAGLTVALTVPSENVATAQQLTNLLQRFVQNIRILF